MSTQTTGGMLSRPLIHHTRPMSSSPCSGARVASPYALVAAFLRRHVDASRLEREQMNGRGELSRLLEVEVTEHGYRLLVGPLLAGPLLVVGAADRQRLSDDEIARHGRWWLDQLP